MYPTNRWRRRWLRWLVVCGAAASAAIVVVLIIVAASPDSSHAARSTPADQATAPRPPNGPVTLIPGSKVINGVQVGFPHSTAGAISAAAAVMSEVFTLDPGHAAEVMRLTAEPSTSGSAAKEAAQGEQSFRTYLGAPATGPLPAGYSAHFVAVEYQVRDVTTDKVVVILLWQADLQRPSVAESLRLGAWSFVMRWEHRDWKIASPSFDPSPMNLTATPNSPKAASLGWKPLRLPHV